MFFTMGFQMPEFMEKTMGQQHVLKKNAGKKRSTSCVSAVQKYRLSSSG